MIFSSGFPHRWRGPSLVFLLLWVASTSQAESTRTVEHASGETDIDGMPQRVVTLYQGATDTAVALGLEPVGVVESWVERPMYRYLRESLGEVEYVGLETQPNLEDIAWLSPDLIVATRYRHEQIEGLLSEIAPTVTQKSAHAFKDTLEMMGEASGREAEARKLLRDWERRVAEFQQQVEQKLGEEWPQEAAVVGFKSDQARIYHAGFAGSILNELGFRRPEAHRQEGWGVKLTSQESIPAMDADVIFVFMDTSDPAVVENYRRWTAHPLWQNLEAVRHERVYQVDTVTWSMGAGILAANLLLDDIHEHYGLEPTREQE